MFSMAHLKSLVTVCRYPQLHHSTLASLSYYVHEVLTGARRAERSLGEYDAPELTSSNKVQALVNRFRNDMSISEAR